MLGGALLLGMLGDWLIRGAPPGVNLTLWVLALVLLGLMLAIRSGLPWTRQALWLGGVAMAAALGFAWRDSPALTLLFAVVLVGTGATLVVVSRDRRMAGLGVVDYVSALLAWGGEMAAGVPRTLQEVRAGGAPAQDRLTALARGALLGVPLLLVFGGLLVEADPVFDRFVVDLAGLGGEVVVRHAAGVLVFGWVGCALLRLVLPRSPRPALARPAGLGWEELSMSLGPLSLLLLVFVAFQASYLFGGVETVESTSGLSLSVYARRGFFELVAVAALSLPVLLVADWWTDDRGPGRRVYRVLAVSLVLLVLLVMVSAVQRMRLYQLEYGLTQLRLYASAFMAWLAVVLGWLLAALLPQHRERFAPGALKAGLAIILALAVVNPDALIVRVNAADPDPERGLDGAYIAGLSHDAVPALLDALPTAGEAGRCAIASRLRRELGHAGSDGGRGWSWSRWGAHRRVEAEARWLRRIDAECAAVGRPSPSG